MNVAPSPPSPPRDIPFEFESTVLPCFSHCALPDQSLLSFSLGPHIKMEHMKMCQNTSIRMPKNLPIPKLDHKDFHLK